MLIETNICSVQIFLVGNTGVNWVPAPGGSSSKRNILWLHTWQITLVKGRWVSKTFDTLQFDNANPHYVWVYLLYCCESAFSNMNFIKNELRSVWQMKTSTTAFVSLSLPWKQKWRNWQEVENAISPSNTTTNNAGNCCLITIRFTRYFVFIYR